MRGPDFQKQEAKNSLWDMDGQHIPKRYRNKGKGRGKDKRLAKAWADECGNAEDIEREEAWDAEVELALDCHYNGPCDWCKSRKERD